MNDERRSPPREAIGLLAEPVRRALYEFVARSAAPVGRDEAAAGVGIGRPLAAFHLDRLARAGLLDVEFRRRSGRTGPGAGRPAKFYRRAGDAVELSIPPRRYGLVARIFATALDRIAGLGGVEAVTEAAGEEGLRIGHEARTEEERVGRPIDANTVDRLLTELGFEPEADADGVRRLRNCPFNDLVADHREVNCGANLAMLSGLVSSMPEAGLVARRENIAGYCCVAFDPARV